MHRLPVLPAAVNLSREGCGDPAPLPLFYPPARAYAEGSEGLPSLWGFAKEGFYGILICVTAFLRKRVGAFVTESSASPCPNKAEAIWGTYPGQTVWHLLFDLLCAGQQHLLAQLGQAFRLGGPDAHWEKCIQH